MNQILEQERTSADRHTLIQSAQDIATYTCRDDDPFWIGVEKCLDNGCNGVLVTNDAGTLLGRVDLANLRAAILDGAYLTDLRMGHLVTACSNEERDHPLAPIVDAERRLIGVLTNARKRYLPVAEPDLSHRELRNVLDAFLSTWISSTGDYLRTFEQRFADTVGVGHGIAVSNGTVSLHLALAALGIGEGDEVIVPDLTFAASANTVMHVGARPVLVDVDPDTWCITPAAIEAAITPRTRAVMPVHVFGRPAPMTEISALARSRGLFVIEDCAEAHGARYDGKAVGSFSDVASFSFFANKIITTGEGGICVTDNPDLAARMRMLRDHGMRPERRYWHEEPGFNFRMTNLQAAIGCAQLDRMDDLLAMRRTVHEHYRASLSGIAGVQMPPPLGPRFADVVWFSCARVPAASRPRLIEACKRASIDLRPFFHGLSSMPAYRRFARVCPNSMALSLQGINLPTSRKVTPHIAEEIGDIFREVLETNR